MNENHARYEVVVYADGACAGNGTADGRMGIGVRAIHTGNGKTAEISRHMGPGTNQLAEILAIEAGLSLIKRNRNLTQVTVYSDSEYAIGCLTKPWKPKANLEALARVKKLMAEFHTVGFVWVKGHNKNIGNEIADKLAFQAARDETKK